MLSKTISPLDGRYQKQTEPLAAHTSEEALVRARILVECEYLIKLSELGLPHLRALSDSEKEFLRALPNATDVERVKELEQTTNHDVKAVEYYMKEKFEATSLKDVAEWIHFALTSEDTNNLSHAVLLDRALYTVILPSLSKIAETIQTIAHDHAGTPMLARTHGQSASPTTIGKEFAVFYARLSKQIDFLKSFSFSVKLNGATGNYNAHMSAYPNIDWLGFTTDFIASLQKVHGFHFSANLVTTQIEPHDTYAEFFDGLRRANTILIDMSQDIWRYVSDGWMIQKPKEREVGSSTMPHKINPIDFENAEGNFGLANALCMFFATKLPISRLQRDLSDSTVERNFGVALGHSLLGYNSLLRGLGKVSVNSEALLKALQAHPEVIAEAIQTVLRREGVAVPYEKLKELTRGKEVTLDTFKQFIDTLEVSEEIKNELRIFTPENYIGLAEKIALK